MTYNISYILLCPAQTALENLEKEGITDSLVNTGDLIYNITLRNIIIAKKKHSNRLWFDEIVR